MVTLRCEWSDIAVSRGDCYVQESLEPLVRMHFLFEIQARSSAQQKHMALPRPSASFADEVKMMVPVRVTVSCYIDNCNERERDIYRDIWHEL